MQSKKAKKMPRRFVTAGQRRNPNHRANELFSMEMLCPRLFNWGSDVRRSVQIKALPLRAPDRRTLLSATPRREVPRNRPRRLWAV